MRLDPSADKESLAAPYANVLPAESRPGEIKMFRFCIGNEGVG